MTITVYGQLKREYQREIDDLKRKLTLAQTVRNEALDRSSKALVENSRLRAIHDDLSSRLKQIQLCAHCAVLNSTNFPLELSEESPMEGEVSRPVTLWDCIEEYKIELLKKCAALRDAEARIEDRNVIIGGLRENIEELELAVSETQRRLENSVPLTPETMDIKPVLLQQLECANFRIQTQERELEVLRNTVRPDLEVENLALRTELLTLQNSIGEISNEANMRNDVIGELHLKKEELLEDKKKLREKFRHLEEKYRTLKSEHQQLLLRIEKDWTPISVDSIPVSSACGEAQKRHFATDHNNPSCESGNNQTESNEGEFPMSQPRQALPLPATSQLTNLESNLERERKRADSLQLDLDDVRRMFIERDLEAKDVEQKYATLKLNTDRIEKDLENARSDLFESSDRNQQLSKKVDELEALLAVSRDQIIQLELHYQNMAEIAEERSRAAIAFESKLDAQGRNLIETKRALRQLKIDRDLIGMHRPRIPPNSSPASIPRLPLLPCTTPNITNCDTYDLNTP